jgi:long-chain acyl-CoA synthetase
MAGACVSYARSIPQLAEDMQTVRPTVLIAVPRIFERVYARVRDKLDRGSPLARRLFELAVDLGWRRFLHRQGRGPWAAGLLLAPLLDRLVGAKIRARLGGRLRVAVCGGAPLSPEIARTFIGLGVPLIQGYGLTETSPVISVNTLEDNRPEGVGRPLPDVEVRIGPHDELVVRSPGVMRGYWGQPQATAAVLDRLGWLHTGDQARLAHGHIFITGRIKETLVLSTGEKVPPADIESAILGDSLFAQVLLIGEARPFLSLLAGLDPDGYGRLAAAEGLPADLAEGRFDPRLEEILLRRIQARLMDFPAYATIRRVAIVERPWTIEDGLMTPTMKLKRARILAHFAAELDQLYAGHI